MIIKGIRQFMRIINRIATGELNFVYDRIVWFPRHKLIDNSPGVTWITLGLIEGMLIVTFFRSTAKFFEFTPVVRITRTSGF